MSSLLTYLSPLAPDDSGACGVLYELGGITVIADAGGCAGNVCGFDEPRWYEKQSALFSAGLRDMDAILGRDDLLVKKLAKICEQIPARFTAIIGTPVPAVIATDFRALERMSEKKTGLPCFALPTNGAGRYDKGEEMAYQRVFSQFAAADVPVQLRRLGVLGATPLNIGDTTADAIINSIKAEGQFDEVLCFGMGCGLETIEIARSCEEILVISPSGVRTAEALGRPWRTGFPCLPEAVRSAAAGRSGQRVLVIHQQMAANALRDLMPGCDVTCATWFMQHAPSARPGDFRLDTEQQLRECLQNTSWDVVFADHAFRRAVPELAAEWVDFPHFAVSGRLNRSAP